MISLRFYILFDISVTIWSILKHNTLNESLDSVFTSCKLHVVAIQAVAIQALKAQGGHATRSVVLSYINVLAYGLSFTTFLYTQFTSCKLHVVAIQAVAIQALKAQGGHATQSVLLRPPSKIILFPVHHPGELISAEWIHFIHILEVIFFFQHFLHHFYTEKKIY